VQLPTENDKREDVREQKKGRGFALQYGKGRMMGIL